MKGRNTLLVLGSLLLALAIAEITIRTFLPVRMVGPSFTVYDPVYGKALKKNFTTTRKTPEFMIRFSTNSAGFRGPEAPSGRPILFLGDSFTMGYGVSDGEEFPALVRAGLAAKGLDVPIMNTGMGANGNGRWLKFLRAERTNLKPAAVILQLTSNDFIDNRNERLFELSEDGDLVELPVPPINVIRKVQNFIDSVPGLAELHLVGLVYQAYLSYWSRNDSVPVDFDVAQYLSTEVDPLTYRILDEAINICNEEGWPMIAIIVGITGDRLAIIEWRLRDSGIPLIEAPDKNQRPDLYYVNDGHWNPDGHTLIADRVLSELPKLLVP